MRACGSPAPHCRSAAGAEYYTACVISPRLTLLPASANVTSPTGTRRSFVKAAKKAFGKLRKAARKSFSSTTSSAGRLAGEAQAVCAPTEPPKCAVDVAASLQLDESKDDACDQLRKKLPKHGDQSTPAPALPLPPPQTPAPTAQVDEQQEEEDDDDGWTAEEKAEYTAAHPNPEEEQRKMEAWWAELERKAQALRQAFDNQQSYILALEDCHWKVQYADALTYGTPVDHGLEFGDVQTSPRDRPHFWWHPGRLAKPQSRWPEPEPEQTGCGCCPAFLRRMVAAIGERLSRGRRRAAAAAAAEAALMADSAEVLRPDECLHALLMGPPAVAA